MHPGAWKVHWQPVAVAFCPDLLPGDQQAPFRQGERLTNLAPVL